MSNNRMQKYNLKARLQIDSDPKRSLGMMKQELRHLPKLIAVAYYAVVVTLRLGMIEMILEYEFMLFPFQAYDLVLFGLVPATSGIIGILKRRRYGTGGLPWILFLLGVVGIALSFLPWRWALQYMGK
jgi:hypothetical protein